MILDLQEITLHRVNMALKHPFTTSFGTFREKDFFITEIKDKAGNRGFGESVAFTSPWYSEETVETNLHMMRDFLIPIIAKHKISHPKEINHLFTSIKGNNMAKSAIEGAVWDVYAKREGISLAQALGGKKQTIDVGISLGIEPSIEALLEKVTNYVEAGYKRIKIKIKPGFDVDILKAVRKQFPDLAMMADANSAYTLSDIEHLKKLDELNLTMIEQPLASDDIIDHATLQRELQTPICLDESVHSYEDARKAIELGSCQIINLKIGRVGGLTEAKRIHDLCEEKGIKVWCGGMLEAGVGRAHNIALTTLSGFVLPGDTAGSKLYFDQDIIEPEVVVEDGVITIPTNPGIGYAVDKTILEKYTVAKETFQL